MAVVIDILVLVLAVVIGASAEFGFISDVPVGALSADRLCGNRECWKDQLTQ